MTQPKVPAADQTLRILRLLASSRGPLPASMIASQLELPRSTIYHLLATLHEHGFVMHLPEERRYGLGIAAFELSSAYARQEPLARIGRPLVAALVDRVGFSGHLAVPHGSDVLYIVEERAKGAPTLVTDVNVRLPAQLTASGRAILAALPKAQVRALFPDRSAFVHRHATTPAAETASSFAKAEGSTRGSASDDPQPHQQGSQAAHHSVSADPPIDRYSRLRSVLDDTLTRGFALERGSVTPGLASVASAVLDHREWPVAAVAVTFPEGALDHEAMTQLAAKVRETAGVLSTRIHGTKARAD